jgi:hypothetical protein
MKLIAAFAVGVSLSIALAWPRVTPEVRYFADGDHGLYHTNPECRYGAVVPFSSKTAAADHNLKPCPFCVTRQAKSRTQ